MTAPWTRWTATTRLTIWYAALLIGTQALLGLGTLWAVERSLYATLDEGLPGKAAAVETEVDVSSRGRIHLSRPSYRVIDGLAWPPVSISCASDRSEKLIYQQDALSQTPGIDDEALQQAFGGSAVFTSITTGGGTTARLYLTPVRNRDGVVGAIQVGRSLAEISALLAQLRWIGLGALALAVALSCVGGYLLARRALRPIDTITRTAERISAEDLSKRLSLALPDDELGRLARAFDAMIDRLDRAFQRQRQLSMDAAHELRTPLSIIRAQAESAQARARDPIADGLVLTTICEESERMTQLVESLLSLARIDSGQAITLKPLDLEEILSNISETIAARALDRDIAFTVRLGPAPGSWVMICGSRSLSGT